MYKTTEKFDLWNTQKKKIEFTKNISTKDVCVGEFRWYREGMNIGNEISKDGKFMKVCIILHNKLGNGLYVIAPLTTKYHKQMDQYLIKVQGHDKFGLKPSWIITNQIKLIDKKRMISKTSRHKAVYGLVKKIKSLFGQLIL